VPDPSVPVPTTLSDLERQDMRDPAFLADFLNVHSYHLKNSDQIEHGKLCGDWVRGVFVRDQPHSASEGAGPSAPHFLTDVCLSVRYIRPKLRTERPRKTKIGTEVAHVARDTDTTFKIKRSRVNLNLQRSGAYCGGLPHSLLTQ